LEDSLGGNSLTVLIITCSMSSYNASETLSTLRFGNRAKKIKNKPTANVERSSKKLMQMLDEANEKIKCQIDVITYLFQRLNGILKDECYKEFIEEFKAITKLISANDVKSLYKLLKNGYTAELEESEEPVQSVVKISDKEKENFDKEKIYLNKKLSQSTEKVLKLYIEVSELKKSIEVLKDERKELEIELKTKANEIADLNDQIRRTEAQNKVQIEEYNGLSTQLELRIESISFLYTQRCRDIDKLCKSLDRILFDESLTTPSIDVISFISY